MKVAYIGIKGLPSKGGAERVVEALVTRMPRWGISPYVYCDAEYTLKDTRLEGVQLIRLPTVKGKYLRSASLDLFAALHAVRSGEYDLIHLHNVEASFVLPLLRLRYKVMSSSHGGAYWRAKWGPLAKQMIRLMDIPFMKLSNLVTSVSRVDALDLTRRFGRAVLYIPNGVGEEYTPDLDGAGLILAQHGLKPDGYLLFVAGRIEPTKGAHLAIEAVNAINELPLLVVGDDRHVPEYGARLREMASTCIRFQPFVDDPRIVFGLVAQSVCFIFPSSVEAMSMALLEAAALGTPILCSDIPANREILQNDGCYFESENVQSLTYQLQWLLAHRSQSRETSRQAQQRIGRDYAWDAIAERYAKLYQSLTFGQLGIK